ncbi:MAG: VWA domain-containing protein, partial [Pyrinomonadaceae bacterium]
VAQQPSPSPSPSPRTQTEEQEPVKVFTEEVRLPVIAVDQFGHYDPTVEPEDILVLEDGLAQQVRSVRRIPANVILVLDTGSQLSGLGGQSKRTSLTRDVAISLVNQMKPGTWVSVMQFNNTVETIQPWTTDKPTAVKALKTKLSSGKRARFSDAIAAAARQLGDRPEGSRHVVLITDGVDTGGKIDRNEATKRLMAARATVHIVSYTEFVRQKKEGRPSAVRGGQMPTSSDPITSTDPTQPPGTTRSPSFGISIRFDPQMRRQRKAYEADVKKSQQAMTTMAEETGGRIFLPKTGDQMIAETKQIAQEIGAEYVVSYRPKRPLAEASQGEYRRIEVASRKVGLTLRSRRGYVVPSQLND